MEGIQIPAEYNRVRSGRTKVSQRKINNITANVDKKIQSLIEVIAELSNRVEVLENALAAKSNSAKKENKPKRGRPKKVTLDVDGKKFDGTLQSEVSENGQ